MNILNRVYELYSDKVALLLSDNIKSSGTFWAATSPIFMENRMLFNIAVVSNISMLRDMEYEYGVLPLPKADDKQERYVTPFQTTNGVGYVVPTTSDAELDGLLLEAMASASSDTLMPAYYEVSLQRKYVRDDESAEMLDLLFSTRTVDISSAFNWGKCNSTVPAMFKKDSNTIASDIVNIKTQLEADMKKALEALS